MYHYIVNRRYQAVAIEHIYCQKAKSNSCNVVSCRRPISLPLVSFCEVQQSSNQLSCHNLRAQSFHPVQLCLREALISFVSTSGPDWRHWSSVDQLSIRERLLACLFVIGVSNTMDLNTVRPASQLITVDTMYNTSRLRDIVCKLFRSVAFARCR